MKIGKYKLGRYHAVIEKKMEDGSSQYETDFSSKADLKESVRAIQYLIGTGERVCVFTGSSMRILGIKIYKGKEAIEKLESLKTQDGENR